LPIPTVFSASVIFVAALPSTVTPVRLVPSDSSPAKIITTLFVLGDPIFKVRLVPVLELDLTNTTPHGVELLELADEEEREELEEDLLLELSELELSELELSELELSELELLEEDSKSKDIAANAHCLDPVLVQLVLVDPFTPSFSDIPVKRKSLVSLSIRV
jgi:hypothetical protein